MYSKALVKMDYAHMRPPQISLSKMNFGSEHLSEHPADRCVSKLISGLSMFYLNIDLHDEFGGPGSIGLKYRSQGCTVHSTIYPTIR